MPSFEEELARMLWLKKEGKVQPDERCKLIFPRREAKRRAANKEKRHRIAFNCDETTYSEFHIEKERIMRQFGENPTLFGLFMVEMMKYQTEDSIAEWIAGHEA